MSILTGSTTLGWALWALGLAPEIQDKLRAELLAVPTDNPSMEDLNALPYLDAVLRETLRVHATVPAVARMAVKDCTIPLSEPFLGMDGIKHDHIRSPTFAIDTSQISAD